MKTRQLFFLLSLSFLIYAHEARAGGELDIREDLYLEAHETDAEARDTLFSEYNLDGGQGTYYPFHYPTEPASPLEGNYDAAHQVHRWPNSLVDGCVNAIGGNYVEHDVDLEDPVSRLKLQRTNFNYPLEPIAPPTICGTWGAIGEKFYHQWSWNHATAVTWTSKGDGNLFFYDIEGGKKLTVRALKEEHPYYTNFYSWTNVKHGHIGSRFDGHNIRAKRQHRHWLITMEDGTQRYVYWPDDHREDEKKSKWRFMSENKRVLPDGLSHHYHYNFHDFVQVQGRSRNDKPLSYIRKEGDTYHSPTQSVKFTLTKIPYCSHELIAKVESSHKPTVQYEYVNFFSGLGMFHYTNPLISKRSLPEGRYRRIEYHQRVPWPQPRDRYRPFKIARIIGPSSQEGREIIRYHFDYDKDKTEVVDACGGRQEFFYDRDHRLVKVSSVGAKQSYHRHYKWYTQMWNTIDNPRNGRLVQQWAEDGKTNLYGKTFEYDERGNVVRETLYGNLTGEENKRLDVDHKADFITHACDACTTRYEYSKDRFNVLLKEIQYDGKEIEYVYLPQTNLLMCKFEKIDGKILSRQFIDYDEFSNPCLIIEDDGQTKNPQDLNLRVRCITRRRAYEDGPHIGLLAKESKSYYDARENREKVLQNIEYRYDEKRRLSEKKTTVVGLDSPIIEQYSYDAHGNIIEERLANGAVITRRFDANNNKIYETSIDGSFSTSFTYDARNLLMAKTEHHEDGEYTARFVYDDMDKLIEETDAYGRRTSYVYDSFGRLVQKRLPTPVNPDQVNPDPTSSLEVPCEYFEYDAFGRLTQKTDALGYSEQYRYNCMGQLTFERKQDQQCFTYLYDKKGRVVQTTSGSGSKEVYEHDALGRLQATKRYDGQKLILEQKFLYDGLLQVEIRDNYDSIEKKEYDGLGRVIASETYEGQNLLSRQEWDYDGLDREIAHRQFVNPAREAAYIEHLTSYDESGRVLRKVSHTSKGQILRFTRFSYDLCGRILMQEELHEGAFTRKQMRYNSHGHCTFCEDALGNQTHFSHNYLRSFGQFFVNETIELSPDGVQHTYYYDCSGQKVFHETRNQKGVVVYEALFGYDVYKGCVYRQEQSLPSDPPMQQECEKLDAVITRVRFGPNRQVIQRTDAAGSSQERVRCWQYDDLGRMKTFTKPSGAQIYYEYDGVNNLIHMYSSDRTLDISYVYDGYGRMTKAMQADGAYTERTHNALGHVTHERFEHGYSIEKSYDALGRVIKTTLPAQVKIEREYEDCFLRRIHLHGDFGSYTHEYSEYDEHGRVIRERMIRPEKYRYWWSSEALYELSRSYDKVGRLDSLQSYYFQTKIERFDPLGRVLEMTQGFYNTHKRTFTYDALGQLTGETIDGVQTSYGYNSRKERTAKNQDRYVNNMLSELLEVSSDKNGAMRCEYDLDGRVIWIEYEGKRYGLRYDALDHLTHLYCNGRLITQYGYDGFDRRIRKTSPSQSSWQDFIYDDLFELGSLCADQWHEFRLVGHRKGAETGDTLLIACNEGVFATLCDLQGSIVGWVDIKSASLRASCSYDAYGLLHSGKRLGPWGYVSKRHDEESSWIFYGKRLYLPQFGRWLTRDPKGEVDGSNLYGFIQNNPVYHWDLWGLACSDFYNLEFWNDSNSRQDSHSDALNSRFESELKSSYDELGPKKHERTYESLLVRCESTSKPACELPIQVTINGIANSKQEVLDRAVSMSRELGMNIIAVYNPTDGFVKDITRVFTRPLHKSHKDDAVTAMCAAALQVAHRHNTALGYQTRAVAHSEGNYFAMRSTKLIENKNVLEKIFILGVGGIGNQSKLNKDFTNYDNFIDARDIGVRLLRLVHFNNKHIKITHRYRGFSPLGAHNSDGQSYREYMHEHLKGERK